jgi:polysaccharide deacetylase family protein (PEP-CTERM system associated)
MNNVLSVDVEDYFHVAALSETIKVDEWSQIPPRVVDNTRRLLDLFDRHEVKATHFVLGWVAERFPDLVKEIDARGHEVASHGYSHQLVYDQTPEVFYNETTRSKEILENILGKAVIGYRAASYSITRKSLWALDILHDLGFKYDSSIFPIRHDRYGIPDAEPLPHRLKTPNGNHIVEFPLTTSSIFGIKMPAAGGGYFRLYPYAFSKYLLSKVQKNDKPIVFYLHPWEIDSEQPRVKVSALSTFRHYNNLHKCERRLEKLLVDFSFSTMTDVLAKQDLL